MTSTSGRFRRADRLLRSQEFRCISNTGKRAVGRHFVVLTASSQVAKPVVSRLGITVSRRVGSAVYRNRIKRRIRAWFRRVRDQLHPGTDIVVIARHGATELSSSEMEVILRSLLKAVEVLR